MGVGQFDRLGQIRRPFGIETVDRGEHPPGVIGRIGLQLNLIGEGDQTDLRLREVAPIEKCPCRLLGLGHRLTGHA